MISRYTVKNLIRSILLTSKASRILAFSIVLAVIGLSFAVPQAQAVQYDRTKISAEWSMSQRYQLHPDASHALISQPQITWYGMNAQNQKVPLRVNDTIVDGRATYRIAGFYYGIVDVNSNEGVWDCEGVRCSEFDVTVPPLGAFDAQPYHSSNPYPTGGFERISLDDFSKIPLNELTTHVPRYKVIPAIYGVIEGVTRPKGIYSDSGSSASFSITWSSVDERTNRALIVNPPSNSDAAAVRAYTDLAWVPSDSNGTGDTGVNTYAPAWATWRLSNDYKANPSTTSLRLDLGRIEWRGKEGAVNHTVRVGEKVTISGQTRTVKGFAFGFVPINENISNWNCDPAGPQVSYNTCNFMYKAPVTSVNPNDSLEINVPISSLGTNLAGSTQYKVVPVMVFDDIPGITADPPLVADFAARQALTITWDTSVAVGETVAVPKAAEVEVSSFADDSNESAVKSLTEGLQSVIATVVNIILTIIATIVHALVWLIMQLVVVVLTALLGGVDFFKAANIPDFVKVGWVYVRDLMNSFFIIALIATGVMMMINKGSYRLVNIIRDLIYVAIIINFSLLLGQLVLGLAQVLINTFIDPNLIKDLVLNVKVGAAATFFNTVESEGYLAAARNLTGFSYTAQLVFTIFFEITMVIVLGMLAVLLVVRLVTVWLMLIISPVPYMMDTFFSGVGKKAGKDASMITVSGWWKKFIDNAIFAPVMGFFIILALKLATSPAFSALAGVSGWTPLFIETIKGIFIFGILMKGMEISKSFSIEYSDKIISKAESWRKNAINKGAFTFLPRGVGGLADSAGRAIERQGGKLKGPIGRGLVKGLGKGISRSGIYGFKKLPLYPDIVSGVTAKMAKKVGDDISREKGLDSTNLTSALARGFASARSKKEDRGYASKGFGAAMQYLGATEEDRANELQSQSEVFRKRYKALDTPELKRIFEEASSLAEKRGAFMAMLDKQDMPLDLDEAKGMAQIALDQLAVDKDDIYNRRPDLLSEPIKDTDGNITGYDDTKVVERLMSMTPEKRIEIHDEAAANNQTVMEWIHADLIRKALNINLDQMAQETVVLKEKVKKAQEEFDKEDDVDKKKVLKARLEAKERRLKTHEVSMKNRANDVASRADIEYSKMKKDTLRREIDRLKATIEREEDMLPTVLKGTGATAREARIKLEIAEKNLATVR